MQYPITPESELYSYLCGQCTAILRSQDPLSVRLRYLYELVGECFLAMTEGEHRPLNSLFARIAYAASKYPVDKQVIYAAQRFRKDAEDVLQGSGRSGSMQAENLIFLGLRVIGDILTSPGIRTPALSFLENLPDYDILLSGRSDAGTQRFPHIRVQAVAISREENLLHVLLDDHNATKVALDYGNQEDGFSQAREIEQAVKLIGIPFGLGLYELDINNQGIGRARMVVIEPDYLIDVTSVSETFEYREMAGAIHILRKFLPVPKSEPLLLGNIANYFLDTLIHDPDLDFNEAFQHVFKLHPVEFTQYADSALRDLMTKARMHFDNLHRVVTEIFPKEGIRRERCYIEPSFYIPAFGLQGRLDLFHSRGDNQYDIIELKSGKPFMANAYGLNQKHFVQTLLYDLMIRAANGFDIALSNYVLYSSQHENTLRYAPSTEALQRHAISVRNYILLAELALCRIPVPTAIHPMRAITRLNPEIFRGFIRRDLERYQEVTSRLDPVDWAYVEHLSSFVAREQYLAKVGKHGDTRSNGLAALWLQPMSAKDDAYQILRKLTLQEVRSEKHAMILILQRGEETNPLANFRVGDIVVLYPGTGRPGAVLKSQIHKSTIIGLDGHTVTLQLRAKQLNTGFLESIAYWNIEHDVLDSGFLKMQKAIFSFAESEPRKRALILGRTSPDLPAPQSTVKFEGLDEEHVMALNALLAARDYFLLWGPPGTGKTTIILKNLVKYLYNHTEERMLLLAYTNRAVDEICTAINTLGPAFQTAYIRIGSRSGTHEEHRPRLLSTLMEDVHNRAALKDLLYSRRIVVATVSSILGREEIFNVLRFQHAIVDEASQILDPMLCSILPRVDKWVLIGDHKQLPAVVVQPEEHSKVESQSLRDLGFEDLRYSLFERLYLHCLKKGWTWAIHKLQTQGRMHAKIMDFAGERFYESALRVFDGNTSRDYFGALAPTLPADATPLEEVLSAHRMIFLPSRCEGHGLNSKSHPGEARIVSQVITALLRIHGNDLPSKTGIIVPFRAQIAAIRRALTDSGIDPQLYLIDTVERFQGAAYDIIILSMSVQHAARLEAITSHATDGVDRKLNVAITRAREQFILIGDEHLVQSDPHYQALANACKQFDLSIEHSGSPVSGSYRI